MSHLQQPSGCDFSLDACVIPGFTALARSDVELFRQVLSMYFTICALLARKADTIVGELFTRWSEDARAILMSSEVEAHRQPFNPLVKKGHVADLAAALSTDNGSNLCKVNWGPPVGASCIRNLLCPAGLVVLAWLGDEYAAPILSLIYAFAESHRAFNIAFVKSPVEISHLKLLSLPHKATSVRSIPSVTSPGGAISHLTTKAHTSLTAILQAIYHAGVEHGVAHQSFLDSISPVNISEAVKAVAHQYMDCTPCEDRMVIALLPTQPSLPEYMPNFVNDTHGSWFRNAQYMFDNIRMPAAAALRGDPLAELIWHRYVADILHARMKCMNLSENQVIQHLSQKIHREHQHFVCAQEAAANQLCTVRQWLDRIRDFYFTSGAFRHKLEHAWTQYQSTNATDFNDLIHHIKTYYQMIFLDYAHLAGKSQLLDFAWILFSKIQYLMQPGCTTTVSNTLRMFLPLSNLVSKMQTVLTPAQNLSKFEADESAKEFISWIIQQLQQVRESANTAQRYTNLDNEVNIDFARLGKPKPHFHNGAPALQAAAAVASNRSLNYTNKRNDMQQTPPNRVRSSNPPRPTMVPRLKDYVNTASDADLITWTHTLLDLPEETVPASAKATLRVMLETGPTTFHGALASATSIPPHMPVTQASIIRQFLKVTFLFHRKQCIFCPDNKCNPTAARHKAVDCVSLKNVLPSNVWTALFSTPTMQTVAAWNLGVHRQAAAGHSSQATIGQGQPQGSQKKPRYDLRSSKKQRTENMNIR